MIPHLFKSEGVWACRGAGMTVFGRTARDAYTNYRAVTALQGMSPGWQPYVGRGIRRTGRQP